MPDRYESLIVRLLVACNLDPEILIGSHEDAIVATVQRKVTEGDKRIENAQQAVAHWQAPAEGEHAARLKAEADHERVNKANVGFLNQLIDIDAAAKKVLRGHDHRRVDGFVLVSRADMDELRESVARQQAVRIHRDSAETSL